jgi:hypothetical protein
MRNNKMNGIITKILFPLFAGLAILLSGCAVENQHLAKLPGFEAKSDVIPGLDPPHQRKKLIQEKGAKGAKASEAEKEILVAQLVYEYQTSPDPNMRREAVDALAKIPHTQRDRYLQEIVKDENPFVRLSALEALGKTYSGPKEELTTLLIDRMKADPDKDVRLSAVRILGDTWSGSFGKSTKIGAAFDFTYKNDTKSSSSPTEFSPDDIREGKAAHDALLELGDLLYDKVPAVRYEAMGALQKVSKQDYGNDINRWLQYVRYTKGEVPELPSERKLSEKMPSVALPMFK